MKKTDSILEKVEDVYLEFSEHPATTWLRGILQSLDLEISSTGGVSLSLGQYLERFLFTQADIIARKRIEESVLELNAKLKLVILDQNKFESRLEEYAKLFLRFYAMSGGQESKKLRKAYVNQMVNFLDERNSEESNNLFFQQLLFRLTPEHYSILHYANKILGESNAQVFENSKSLREGIRAKFIRSGLDEEVIDGVIKDLDSMGLMNATQSSTFGGDLHQLFVSKLGRKLLNQVEEIKK